MKEAFEIKVMYVRDINILAVEYQFTLPTECAKTFFF